MSSLARIKVNGDTYDLKDATARVQSASIALSSSWNGSGPYTQTITVSGATVTTYSKIDLQPNSSALAQLASDGVIALWVENDNATLTAKALGAAPTSALTIQCTITEVGTP